MFVIALEGGFSCCTDRALAEFIKEDSRIAKEDVVTFLNRAEQLHENIVDDPYPGALILGVAVEKGLLAGEDSMVKHWFNKLVGIKDVDGINMVDAPRLASLAVKHDIVDDVTAVAFYHDLKALYVEHVKGFEQAGSFAIDPLMKYEELLVEQNILSDELLQGVINQDVVNDRDSLSHVFTCAALAKKNGREITLPVAVQQGLETRLDELSQGFDFDG